MSLQRLSLVALLLGALAFGVGRQITSAQERNGQKPDAANARARLDAAKNVYEYVIARHTEKPKEHPLDVEYLCRWSVRWMQAERDLSGSKKEHIAALEGHLKRMQFWKELQSERLKIGAAASGDLVAAQFFVIEAEGWLAAAKSE